MTQATVPPAATPTPTPPPVVPQQAPAQKDNQTGLTVTALILAIISFLMAFIPFINIFTGFLGIVAIVLSIIALVGAAGGKKGGKGMAIAGLVIGAISLIIIVVGYLVIGIAVNSKLGDARKSVDEISKSVSRTSGEATDELLKNDVTVEIGKFSAVEGDYGIVKTKLPVKLTNKNKEAKSYNIKIEAVSNDGTRVDESTVYVTSLGSGQSVDEEAFTYIASDKLEDVKNAKFKVLTVSQF